jgi:hypothetical protein
MTIRTLGLTRFSMAVLLAWTTDAAAQAARNQVATLYASADYETALAVLGDDGPGGTTDEDVYRAYCLIALGRPADAVIERIYTRDPLFQADAGESPRVRSAFRAVRTRLLPSIARTLYADGKAAFDRREFPEAARAFERALPVAETLWMEGRPEMEDVRTLAIGFLTLSREKAGPPPVTPPVLPSRETPISRLLPFEIDSGAAPVQAVPVKQDLPAFTYPLGPDVAILKGSLDVDINSRGEVTRAAVVQTLHPQYDLELLRAARGWIYEPATRAGRPVASLKRVEVEVKAR